MDATPDSHDRDTADRLETQRRELVGRIEHLLGDASNLEPIEGVRLYRETSPTRCQPEVAEPTLCMIAQGAKELLVGDQRYRYDPNSYLLTTAELPVTTQILEASPEQPFLGVILDLDPKVVSSVMVESGHPVSETEAETRGIDVSTLDTEMMDAVLRLVRLAESDDDGEFLGSLITREIIYRLLRGNSKSVSARSRPSAATPTRSSRPSSTSRPTSTRSSTSRLSLKSWR